jgi:hypothetical protein
MSNCPICLEQLSNEIKTSCNHLFCKKCLDTWLSTKHTCPLCRNLLKQPSEIINNRMNLQIDVNAEIIQSFAFHSNHFNVQETIRNYTHFDFDSDEYTFEI